MEVEQASTANPAVASDRMSVSARSGQSSETTSGASDAALARRAGLGDANAFSELFDRHFEASFRFARHMLDGDEDLAHDATQTAWIKAWRHLPDFRGDSRFQTWLFTIVSREAQSLRRRRRPVPVDDSIMEIDGNTSPTRVTGDPEAAFVHQEVWRNLVVALAELPWRQKACWLLREFEGLSYEEIARILDTTPTVVRGQLHRARRALALRMEQWR